MSTNDRQRAVQVVAFYLPQFHPIPENDAWWGPGFTEWTNTAKARPLFRGHYQPHVPADLGYYDLRLPETRTAQAEMARAHGVAAFCYYHYWFAGKQLLERPFQEVVSSGEPDFPFCLCWANESWTGIWHGAPGRVLIEQTYPGPSEDKAHFAALLPAFTDPRYLKVDGKPLFMIYSPLNLPEPRATADRWRSMAVEAGLGGLHLVGNEKGPWKARDLGFDAAVPRDLGVVKHSGPRLLRAVRRRMRRARRVPVDVYPYREAIRCLERARHDLQDVYPFVVPNWDNTPRSGRAGLVLHGSTPELFRVHLRDAVATAMSKPVGRRLVFVKSWNEWAEGNHLEPDRRFGRAYLEVVRDEVLRAGAASSDDGASRMGGVGE